MKTIIETKNAPSAIGPYSQAVCHGNTLYISGQLPLSPSTGLFSGDDITSQTKQCLDNLKAILEEAGSDLNKVLKTTVLLKDIADFSLMNEVYAGYFESECPARAAFQVAELPKSALVEIEAIAYVE